MIILFSVFRTVVDCLLETPDVNWEHTTKFNLSIYMNDISERGTLST